MEPKCTAKLDGGIMDYGRICPDMAGARIPPWAWAECYAVTVLHTSTNDDRTKWYWTKWYRRMVRTKWYGQNGSNFCRFQFNRIEFLFSNHKSQISDKPNWVLVEAGLMKKIVLSMEAGFLD